MRIAAWRRARSRLYPVVNCACKLDEGDVLGTVNDICLRRPMPVESTLWMLQVSLTSASRQEVCFAAMDSANSRLQDAFNQAFRRLYDMTRHAAQIADGLLALVTGDTVACDAWDMSPYVLSIIPEPVDYFMSCINTDDCTVRCLDEISAFNTELQTKRSQPGHDLQTLRAARESVVQPQRHGKGLEPAAFFDARRGRSPTRGLFRGVHLAQWPAIDVCCC